MDDKKTIILRNEEIVELKAEIAELKAVIISLEATQQEILRVLKKVQTELGNLSGRR